MHLTYPVVDFPSPPVTVIVAAPQAVASAVRVLDKPFASVSTLNPVPLTVQV